MAQTQLYMKRAQVFCVEESGQDTYLEQVAGDAVLAEQVTVTIDSTNYEPTTVRGDFLSTDETPGMASVAFNFRVPLHGSGTAGTAPEFDSLLKASGFKVVNVPVTSDTYTPLSTFDGAGGNPGPSYSCTLLEDGVSYKAKGGFATVVFEGAVGDPMFMNFTFTGAYQAVTDDALETASYNSVAAPPFKGATFATNFGGAYTPKGINNFNLDLGNTVALMHDINDASGNYGARITGRKSIGSFDPEMVLVATEDFFGQWVAGTTGTIATGVVGSTAGNKWSLAVARAVKRAPEMGDRDGVRILSVPYAVSSAGSDVEGTNADITLAFT